MSHLDVALAARAYRDGRGYRVCRFRHRHLVRDPLAVVIWQLGAEPFSAAAIGFGSQPDRLSTVVAGEPRNRDLAFAALLEFARWFNPRFEAHVSDCDTVASGSYTFRRAKTAPQLLVANAATVELLGRLGRRLAYLPTTGPNPADEALVRLGRHLRFLWDHWSFPGQQLVLSLTDLLNDHWVTPQSPFERQSLAALDAYIDPPTAVHGFDAAARAENDIVGPVPAGEDDERLHPLVEVFNKRRAGSTQRSVVSKLIAPIEDHYQPLVDRAWTLLWRCRQRELKFSNAASVGRRWEADRTAYTRHMDWMAKSGLRRTRQTVRQAAMTLRNLEDAKRQVEAEEACDDPLRMIPYILDNKAIRGRVVSVDREYRERASRVMVRRPLVRLLSPDPCLIPVGRELWWTDQPSAREFVVHSIEGAREGLLVALKLMTSSSNAGLPELGDDACFSIHTTREGWLAQLPPTEPWTHRRPPGAAVASTIEI